MHIELVYKQMEACELTNKKNCFFNIIYITLFPSSDLE